MSTKRFLLSVVGLAGVGVFTFFVTVVGDGDATWLWAAQMAAILGVILLAPALADRIEDRLVPGGSRVMRPAPHRGQLPVYGAFVAGLAATAVWLAVRAHDAIGLLGTAVVWTVVTIFYVIGQTTVHYVQARREQ